VTERTDAQRAHVVISGRVQGVGFRYTASDEARRMGLSGWVRNLDSGQVEAVFEGPRLAVEQMVQWCRTGPPGAWVSGVSIVWDEPLEDLATFEIRRSGYAPRL
jgi:acylphosphatase